jgi:hypothetical protein
VDSVVAVVGLGVDAMQLVFIEELGDHSRKRLGRESGALTIRCERNADLGGSRLISVDADSAVATHGPTQSVDRRQLHPRSSCAELDAFL